MTTESASETETETDTDTQTKTNTQTKQKANSSSANREQTAEVSPSTNSSGEQSDSGSPSVSTQADADNSDTSVSAKTIIQQHIESAAENVGAVWPIHSFVTANPLDGFEDEPFHKAVAAGATRFGGDGYPDSDVFKRAWKSGRINHEILAKTLSEYENDHTPASAIAAVDADTTASSHRDTGVKVREQTDNWSEIDTRVIKWLSAFLDAGSAEWEMPNREKGFYTAFQAVATYDTTIPDTDMIVDPPADPVAAVSTILESYPQSQWSEIIEAQMTALPGWTGFIRHRIENNTEWQTAYPITLTGYLAVRVILADALSISLDTASRPPQHLNPSDTGKENELASTPESIPEIETHPLQEIILTAWERTYREGLIEQITDTVSTESHEQTTDTSIENETGSQTGSDSSSIRPDAQLVFCIDTRSEIIRRHIESTGRYETYGYAGFFGIPMRYRGYDDAVRIDACPPIVDAQHRISESSLIGETDKKENNRHNSQYERIRAVYDAGTDIIDALAANVTTAFNFVETTGGGYGVGLAVRTLFPQGVYNILTHIERQLPRTDALSQPQLSTETEAVAEAEAEDVSECGHTNTVGSQSEDTLPYGLTHQERVEYAASAFELMGLETFSRVVGFIGHASQTANNPFGSSLDCGACAGNAGGPSARVLAQICNDDAVKTSLRDRGIDIPVDTVFIAGEHTTTTDKITLYTEAVPESHQSDITSLQADLSTAQKHAAADRAESLNGDTTTDAMQDIERRAADWAETRPEWGLAGNAGFVVGPRCLTDDIDLEGRVFLHSYDWQQDETGKALESILSGPLIVTQWINTQYYFATVDTAVYGSGSKITQNPVGNIGIYQGNGGDLMRGLPIQSVRKSADNLHHQPIRLSTVVYAPVSKVTQALADLDSVTELLDNNWLSLTVIDPTRGNDVFHYVEDLRWLSHDGGYKSNTTAYISPKKNMTVSSSSD